ncbi:PQQ-dependent sugar dehydrogenase [Mycolicibacterium hodleri]|uniref:PKD domain-containing protein n=1 Tax=Mycolicibacterium hodleri TaxID=49897 RepID=A0A502DYH8_9MYCO|nr:PQQ-dependent sugar dehydrogenase [Mycolicibacterium hodleri]TPG29729.1 PKD domain-containing protein [Mycolicibacterium hodleri]
MGESAAIATGNRPPSGYAKYVGRVGGLAFALGVGAAILIGAGAASANTGESGAGDSGGATSHSSPGPRTREAPRTPPRASASSDNRQSIRESRRLAHRDSLEGRRAARQAANDSPTAAARPTRPVQTVTIRTAVADPASTPAVSSLGSSGAKTTETPTATATAVDRTVVASGLDGPVDFQFLPDGRIVVAEKGGKIKIVEDGTVSRRPLVRLPVLTQGERGINGIAVDPDFATNGYLYVAYTTRTARDRLTRLTVVGDRVKFGSPKVLLETTDRSELFHHGGALGFGPDGKLYWGVGDNKNGANAQDLSTIHGKVIRINPDGSVPTDNPDLGPGALPVIYASGFRNPFRLTFTPTGELLLTDVGENSFEELNLVTAGGNYGWPNAEGNCAPCASIDPIYTYAHNGGGAAITSVLFYDGGLLGAAYQDKVFITDEVQGWMKVLTCSADFSSCGDVQDFDPAAGTSVVLRQAPDGSIYQLTYAPGQLVRIAGASPAAALV